MRPTFAWNPELRPAAETQDDCLESAAIRAAYDAAGLPPPPSATPAQENPGRVVTDDFDAAFDSAFSDEPKAEEPLAPAPTTPMTTLDEEPSVAPSSRSAPVEAPRSRRSPSTSTRRALLAVAVLGGVLGAGLAAVLTELGRAAPVSLPAAVSPPVAALGLGKGEPVAASGPSSGSARVEPPLAIQAAPAHERVLEDPTPSVRKRAAAPTKGARPRVLIERAPYRSIPLKAGEKMATFPVD